MSFGGAVKLTGESEYREALRKITQNLKEVSSEMKVVNATFDGSDRSIDALAAKQGVLNKTLSEQTNKLKTLQAEYSSLSGKYSEQTSKHQQLVQKYNEEKTKLEQIKHTLGETSDEYAAQKKVVADLAGEVKISTRSQEANEKSMSKMRVEINNAKADCQKTTNELNKLSQAESEAGSNAETSTRGMGEFKGSINDVGTAALSVGDIIKANLISATIISGIKGLVNQVKEVASVVSSNVIQGGMSRALNIEQAQFKLKGLGHDAQSVEQIMNDALAAVKGTAYGLDEAATIAASAVAAGIEPGEELERTLKMVADAATISGRDMGSMGAIFNKVAAAGKMTGEELNQLTDSGIPVLQLLAETMGVTTEEIRGMVSAGEVGFAELQAAIEKGMGGAALTMGETFNGAVSNMKAAASRLGASFMQPFLESMTPAIGTFTELIDNITSGNTLGLKDKVSKLSGQLSNGVSSLIKNVSTKIKNAIPVITEVLKGIISILPDLLKQAVEHLQDILPLIMDAVKQIVHALAEALTQNGSVISDGIATITSTIIKGLVAIIPDLVKIGFQFIKGLATGILKALPELAKDLPSLLTMMGVGAAAAAPKILSLVNAYTQFAAAKKTLSAANVAETATTKGSMNALLSFTKAIPLKPIAIAVGAIAGLCAVLSAMASAAEEGARKYNDLTKETFSAIDASKAARSAMSTSGDALAASFDKAKDKIDDAMAAAALGTSLGDELVELNSKTSRTADEQARMESIVAQLNTLYPELKLSIDQTTGALNRQNGEIEDFIKKSNESLKAQAYQAAYKGVLEDLTEAMAQKVRAETEAQRLEEKILELQGQKEAAFNAEGQALMDNAEARREYDEALANGGVSSEEALARLNERQRENNALMEASASASEQYAISQEAAQEELEKNQKALEEQNSIIEESGAQLEYLGNTLRAAGYEIPGVTVAIDEATGEISELGVEAGTTASETSTAVDTLAGRYAELKDAAYESVQGQISAFDELSSESDKTIYEMNDAIQSQIDTLNRYEQNSNKALEYINQYYQDGGKGASEFLQTISEMGIDGAGYLDQFVWAIENDADYAAALLEKFGNLDQAEQNFASGSASLQQTAESGLQNTVDTAKEKMLNLKENMTEGSSIAVQDMATNIEGASGEVQQATQTVVDTATTTMTTSAPEGAEGGSELGGQYAEGISAQKGNVTSAVANLKVATQLLQYSNAYSWGQELGSNFANGISSKSSYVASAAKNLADRVHDFLGHSTPKKGALHGDDKWGDELATNFAKGINRKTGEVGKAASNLAKAVRKVLKGRSNNVKARYSDAALARIDAITSYNDLALKEEEKFWKKLIKKTKKGSAEYKLAQKALKSVRKEIQQENKNNTKYALDYAGAYGKDKANQISVDLAKATQQYLKSIKAKTAVSKAYVEQAVARAQDSLKANERTLKQEVDFWEGVTEKAKKGSKKGSAAYKKANAIYNNLKKDITKQTNSLTNALIKDTKAVSEQLAKDLAEVTKKLNEDIAGVKEGLANNVQDLKDAYRDTVKARKEAITSSLSLFDKASTQLEAAYKKDSYIEILKRQVANTKSWDATLTALGNKIKNKGLLEELQSLGVEQLNVLKMFDSMSAQELQEYEALFDEREKIANRRATAEHTSLYEETLAQIAEITAAADAEIEALKTAADKEKKELIAEANKELKALRKEYLANLKELGITGKTTASGVGKQIANGIKTGFTNGMKNVNSSVKTQLQNMLNEVKKTLKIKSPSQVMRDEVGDNLAKGIGVGFVDEMKFVSRQMQDAIPTSFDTSSATSGLFGLQNSTPEVIVENRFYLGERDITDLITKKVVKRITTDTQTARLAKGAYA